MSINLHVVSNVLFSSTVAVLRVVPLRSSPCPWWLLMWCLFEGSYYFVSLYAKYSVNFRLATKWGVQSIEAYFVNAFSSLLFANSWLRFCSLHTYPSQCVNSHAACMQFLTRCRDNCFLTVTTTLVRVMKQSWTVPWCQRQNISCSEHYLIYVQPPLSLTSGCVCCGHPMYAL